MVPTDTCNHITDADFPFFSFCEISKFAILVTCESIAGLEILGCVGNGWELEKKVVRKRCVPSTSNVNSVSGSKEGVADLRFRLAGDSECWN